MKTNDAGGAKAVARSLGAPLLSQRTNGQHVQSRLGKRPRGSSRRVPAELVRWHPRGQGGDKEGKAHVKTRHPARRLCSHSIPGLWVTQCSGRGRGEGPCACCSGALANLTSSAAAPGAPALGRLTLEERQGWARRTGTAVALAGDSGLGRPACPGDEGQSPDPEWTASRVPDVGQVGTEGQRPGWRTGTLRGAGRVTGCVASPPLGLWRALSRTQVSEGPPDSVGSWTRRQEPRAGGRTADRCPGPSLGLSCPQVVLAGGTYPR